MLQAALSLAKRPPFHNTTLIPIVTAILFGLCHVVPPFTWCPQLPSMFFIAWLSHHIRDGVRRGIWFAPLGSTLPIPHFVYLLTIALLPILFRLQLLQQHRQMPVVEAV